MTPYPHTHTGPAVVLGSAASAMDDLRAALSMHPPACIVACNHMADVVNACHIVSSHPSFFEKRAWLPWETTHLVTDATVGHHPSRARYCWPGLKEGSTGLAAARIARRIGYFPVILCGVPIDDVPYIDGYCPTHPDWRFGGDGGADIERYRQAWRRVEATGELEGVLSMSGWTAELLGSP